MRIVRAYDFVANHTSPGDRVTLLDGTVLLVGDVNRNGGVCDDCPVRGEVESDCDETCCPSWKECA